MTTIKDPKAMTTQDPRWLTWYVQQRRFERIKRGGYTAPSLVLSFENEAYQMGAQNTPPDYRSYSDLITFTRASGGGITNAAGQFEWVGNNVPRITYDPVTLRRIGQLIEEQRTNLLLHSANPANVAWTKTSATIGTNVTGPAGLNAQRLVEAAGAGLSPDISQSATVTSGATVVGMRFVKAGERSFVRMQIASTGGTAYAASRFNLADGAKVAGDSDVALNSTTNVKSGSVNYGSGWWMIWLSCTLPAGATTARLATRIVADASSFGYTGDGVSAIYIGPAQLEVGSSASSYIPTTTAQVTRAADSAAVNTLSPWYNPPAGTWKASAAGIVGQAIVTAGTAIILADSTSIKDYSLSYSADQSATSLVIGKGTISSISYFPRSDA